MHCRVSSYLKYFLLCFPGAFSHALANRRKGYQKSDTKQLRSFEEYETDKDRLLALHYAKTHVVLGLEPFDFMENEERRTLLETMLPAKSEDKPFKAGKLNAKMVRRRDSSWSHVLRFFRYVRYVFWIFAWTHCQL